MDNDNPHTRVTDLREVGKPEPRNEAIEHCAELCRRAADEIGRVRAGMNPHRAIVELRLAQRSLQSAQRCLALLEAEIGDAL